MKQEANVDLYISQIQQLAKLFGVVCDVRTDSFDLDIIEIVLRKGTMQNPGDLKSVVLRQISICESRFLLKRMKADINKYARSKFEKAFTKLEFERLS